MVRKRKNPNPFLEPIINDIDTVLNQLSEIKWFLEQQKKLLFNTMDEPEFVTRLEFEEFMKKRNFIEMLVNQIKGKIHIILNFIQLQK